jgi:hypothetical protein
MHFLPTILSFFLFFLANGLMADVLFQSSMVIGPVLGYFDQIVKFRKTQSSTGFSLDTSGILLVSR